MSDELRRMVGDYNDQRRQAEADNIRFLEGYIDGSLPIPEREDDLVFIMTRLAIFGHIYPGLRERFAQPDAQALLEEVLRRLPTE